MSGCGCGGATLDAHETRAQLDCGCGCDHVEQAAGIDFGQRFSLDSAAGESTATEPFSTAGASVVEVCATIFSQAGAATLTLVLLGTADGDNFFTITTQAVTGGVGYYAFSSTGLVWRELRIGAEASGGSVPIVFSLYANLTCA